eukprot:gene6240-7771_t
MAKNQYEVQDSALVVTLVINVVIAIVGLIVFSIIRTKYKSFYEYRYWSNQKGVDAPPNQSFFGWISSTLSYDNNKVIQHAGLDGYMYLRQVKTNLFIMLTLMILGAIMLYPTNAVGKYNENREPNEDGELPDKVVGLTTIAMSNIERGSSLLWVHLVFTLIVTGVVLFFAYFDYKEYTAKRITFKQQDRLMNHSIYVRNIPEHLFNKESIHQFFDSYFPGQLRDSTLLYPLPGIYKLISQRETLVKKYESVLATIKKKNKKIYVKKGFLGCCGEKEDATEFYPRRIDELTKEIEAMRDNQETAERKEGGTGFFVFNQKQTAKTLTQVIMNKNYPYQFVRYEAPDPNDIWWGNIHVGVKAFWIKTLIVGIFMFFLIFFWSIPVTFLSGFSNLGTLAKVPAFSWLVDIINKSSVLSGFLQGFLPNLVLIIFMALLIPIMTALSKAQGFFSNSDIEKSVFRKYFLFLVFNIFLVSAIAGSIFQSIEAIAENPSSIVPMLANSLGGISFQMINIVMISSVGSLLAVLRLIGLIIRQIKLKWLAKTYRQIRDTKKCGSFSYGVAYAKDLLVLQISLAYSTLAPFILVFGSIYFAGTYLCSKYNIIWVNTPSYQGGGKLHPSSFRRTLVGLLIYHLLMIGTFNIYKFFWGNLVVIPLVITLVYWAYCEIVFNGKSQHGVLDAYNQEEIPLQPQEFNDTTVSYNEYNGLNYQPCYYKPLLQVDEYDINQPLPEENPGSPNI